jgi:nucleotide-binding universal stress UspA family protein
MYNKMLVLLDGSKLAEVVFTYAQELSARLNLTLELLHVCSSQEAEQLPMHQAYIEHMAEILQSKASEIRSKIGGTTQGKSMQAKGKVVVGYPAEEILKYADENKIDLIMLSTHGRSGIRIWDLGSVADKVIHTAKVPIWLVPSELREEIIWDKLPKRTIVIPLGGSKLSEVAIPHAINIAKQRGAQAEIVLAYVESSPLSEMASTQTQLEQIQTARLSAKKYLDEQVQQIGKEGITARAEMLIESTPPGFIDFVKNNPAQLIVMAAHSYTGIRGMIFDGVAEQIIRLAKKTPIFIAKPSE